MSVPLIISALWLLCMFAAVTHAAQPFNKTVDAGVLLLSAMLTLALTRWLIPQPGWVGVLIGLSAIWQLLRGASPRMNCVLAGGYSALAAVVYENQGLPLWLSVSLCVGLVLSCMQLARGNRFVSPLLRQQALLGLAWIAPCIAAFPSVMAGWQSAQALNRTIATAGNAMPAWTWQFVLCALVLGLVRGWWVRQ